MGRRRENDEAWREYEEEVDEIIKELEDIEHDLFDHEIYGDEE